ncbi:VOC family protein [Oceanobacillus chungangensis]|uniref:Glyoxalase n=1 Tax=Oceanobacillus chungangensis TaxID=1229152 RepID=A0A3D8PUH5_9BACI|nr:VOC family protein [Oceanobacillus chungangensis]RDW19810.1 glyoxalase [Oceanobacillus chungangensis]
MVFQFESIDHVQLAAPVGSEETAREFYRGLLGFQEVQKPASLQKNGGVWFQAGQIQLHIGIDEPFDPAKKAHPAFRVKNLQELKLYLSTKGVKYTEDDKLPNASRIYINDPFGNRLEFLEWQN